MSRLPDVLWVVSHISDPNDPSSEWKVAWVYTTQEAAIEAAKGHGPYTYSRIHEGIFLQNRADGKISQVTLNPVKE